MTKILEILPPQRSLKDVTAFEAFRVVEEEAFLWYEPGDTRLVVSFDNLATLDHPYPRLPWLHRVAAETGVSFLGVQSARKDWFRNETTPALLRALVAQDFFNPFSRISFIGASMGAFGALNFAPLVKGANVLALSPQSTMNQMIAPFEERFRWAVRNTNWIRPSFLDAAEAIADIPKVSLLFDPFVPEDRAHAARLAGPNVQQLKLRHATHEAIRVVVKAQALNQMLAEFSLSGELGPAFWQHMRGRRDVRKWARSFIANVQQSNQPKRILRAAEALIAQDNYLFASRARQEVLAAHPDLAKI